MAKDYSKSAASWATGIQQSGQKWLAGVQATDVNPAAAAVQQQQKMMTNWNNAITSGRWAQALSKVSTASWQQATTAAGSAKYTSGASKGAPKMAAFFAAAGPVYQQARALRQSQADPMSRIQQNLTLMASLKGITKR